jgi:hypothetical protein
MSFPRVALASLLFLALSSPAVADPTLNLKITDNVGGGYDVDMNGSGGFVNFNGAIGAWSINVTTGLGSGSVATDGELDLSSVDVTNVAGSHHLTIILTESGLSAGTGAAFLSAANAIGGTSPNISWSACAGSTCSSGSSTAPPLGFSSNAAFLASIADLSDFTLSITIDILHTDAQTSSLDNSLILAVPLVLVREPQPLLLLGAGLLALALARGRRRH